MRVSKRQLVTQWGETILFLFQAFTFDSWWRQNINFRYNTDRAEREEYMSALGGCPYGKSCSTLIRHKSDNCLALSVTHSATYFVMHSLLLLRVNWCDSGLRRCQFTKLSAVSHSTTKLNSPNQTIQTKTTRPKPADQTPCFFYEFKLSFKKLMLGSMFFLC